MKLSRSNSGLLRSTIQHNGTLMGRRVIPAPAGQESVPCSVGQSSLFSALDVNCDTSRTNYIVWLNLHNNL